MKVHKIIEESIIEFNEQQDKEKDRIKCTETKDDIAIYIDENTDIVTFNKNKSVLSIKFLLKSLFNEWKERKYKYEDNNNLGHTPKTQSPKS